MRGKTVLTFVTLVLLAGVMAFHGSTGFAQQGQRTGGVIMNPGPAAVPVIQTATPPVLGAEVVSFGPEDFQSWDRTAQLTRDNLMMIRPLTPAGQPVYLDAPVELPQGAVVKQVVAYIMDNDATYDVQLLWVAHPFTSEVGIGTASVFSSGASSSISFINLTNIASYQTIDNTQNSYFVRVVMFGGASTWLNAVRVEYTFPTALPAIMR